MKIARMLDIDDVTAGMVLSRELRDAHGAVLLPAQTELSDATLVSLRRRGIDSVMVDCEEEVDQAELARQREHLQRRLTHLFRRCGTEGANGNLHELVGRHRLGQG